MNKKIKIGAYKFGLFADGGTEKFLQTILAHLPKDKFDVDAYYTEAAPYLGSDYKHSPNNPRNLQYLKDHGVNIIPVHVDFKDIRDPTHPWVGTNFFELFDESKYDVVTTARAGHKEFPTNGISNTPIVEIVTLPNMADRQENIVTTIHISQYQKQTWINAGGDQKKAVVLPIISELPIKTKNDLREELGIPKDAFVFGMHQRNDPGIYSNIALQAYKQIMNKDTWFVIMGGSDLYTKYAKENNLINFVQLEHSGDPILLDKFLNTLNTFTHSRADGETFGQCIVDAMSYAKPILSHTAPAMGHAETIGDAGFVCSTVNEYADYMIKLLNNVDGLRDKLSKNAVKKYNKDYSIPKIMENIIQIYENAANNKLQSKMSDEEFWGSI